MFSIGALSRQTGVKVPTIRFYEEKGLMPKAERTSGNQRRYTHAAIKRLAFIRHTRDLGLPLSDVAALISLEGATGDALNDAHAIARRQRDSIRNRIAQLQRLERELSRIARACDGQHEHVCEVLHALSDHTQCAENHGRAGAPLDGH